MKGDWEEGGSFLLQSVRCLDQKKIMLSKQRDPVTRFPPGSLGQKAEGGGHLPDAGAGVALLPVPLMAMWSLSVGGSVGGGVRTPGGAEGEVPEPPRDPGEGACVQ